jgi:hypothetical protein
MNQVESLENFAARMRVFIPNRAAFPAEELRQYAGQWIAWSPDGTAIVAGHSDPKQLDELVRAAGHDPFTCVHSYIPEADTSFEGFDAQ